GGISSCGFLPLLILAVNQGGERRRWLLAPASAQRFIKQALAEFFLHGIFCDQVSDLAGLILAESDAITHGLRLKNQRLNRDPATAADLQDSFTQSLDRRDATDRPSACFIFIAGMAIHIVRIF